MSAARLNAVPVDRLVIEAMNHAGEWERVQGAAA